MTLEVPIRHARVHSQCRTTWSGRVCTEFRNIWYNVAKRILKGLSTGGITNRLIDWNEALGIRRRQNSSKKVIIGIKRKVRIFHVNLSNDTGQIEQPVSALTTAWPCLSWSALLFSMKIEIKPSPNWTSLIQISDSCKNLRKPKKG